MTTFGAILAVDGVRPTYVRDGDLIGWDGLSRVYAARDISPAKWRELTTIQLRADHPYYLVAQHPGMVMHVGDTRPGDFDAGKPVLLRDGSLVDGDQIRVWEQNEWGREAIAYHPLPASPSVEDDDDGPCTDCDDTGITIQTERRCACQPPEIASWAFAEADRRADGSSPQMRWHLAKLIAQHEAPPVDEATELWWRLHNQYWGNDGADDTESVVAILRAHLAKVRSEGK